MKVFKCTNNDIEAISLDEKDEIYKIVPYEYVIRFDNKEEYDNVESTIMKGVELGLDVYHGENNTSKLEYDSKCNKVFATCGVTITLTSNDETKTSILENLVKEIMIKNKEYLN